jgi:transposase InsO family protein
MNPVFAETVRTIPDLFDRLHNAPPLDGKGTAAQKGLAGVYVFLEDGKVVHVGRTRNLQGRLRAHSANSHHSASFAFKRARRALGMAATYKTAGSRADLLAMEAFRQEFDRQRQAVRGFKVRFLAVADPVRQYLLELYAHMEYGLPLDEFDTH